MWMIYALLSAAFFGLRGILYHWTSLKPINRNLMLFGVFFTGAIVSLVLSLLFHQEWTTGVLIGVFMGAFSFTANACMYKGFAVGKASLVAILSGLPPVVVVILAYLRWGESLSRWQFVAFAVIVIGILMIRYSNDLTLKRLQGAQWGLLAMLFFSLNDMSSKQTMLLDVDMFPTLFLMFVTGSVLFCGWWLVDKISAIREGFSVESKVEEAQQNPWSEKKTFLWGMLVGITNVSGMMLILPAFKYGVTGLVSAVVSMNVLLILLYTRLFLKEKFTLLELSGICFSFLGIIILRIAQ